MMMLFSGYLEGVFTDMGKNPPHLFLNIMFHSLDLYYSSLLSRRVYTEFEEKL